MSRLFYVLAVVILIAACSNNTSARCYRDGHCPIFENSFGQVPTQMTWDYCVAPKTYYQPIDCNTATSRAYSNPSVGRSYRRPVLFPRLRRLIRTLIPPYDPGAWDLFQTSTGSFAMTEREAWPASWFIARHVLPNQ
ncbi:MAG: hypothetical protein CMJ62_00925 [Planctomycetaceae bacterium]|nr:hypothetical protein [Planctomycetaceae bacterium]